MTPQQRFSISRIVSLLIFADLAVLAGWGLVNPIISVFVTQKISGGSLAAVGIAVSIFWFTRAVLMVPIAAYLDRATGERNDFEALVMGLMISATAAFLMPLATTVTHIYLIEFIHAVAFSFYIPAWTALFTHHVDPGHTALEWALDRSVGSVATGISAILGGFIASEYGFTAVFITAGSLSVLAAIGVLLGPRIVIPQGIIKIRHPWQALSEGVLNKIK